MVQPSRKYDVGSGYRYGFNGKEKDNSTGEGNLDFGARIYDGRIGRFLSVDPLYRESPNLSPYIFAGNNPVKFIDADGLFKLDPSLQKSYPLVYKYLSTQLEKDVLNSSKIINGFKTMNPKLRDANIRGTFTNNSGPSLAVTDYPGMMFNTAAGFYDYDSRMVEINTKIIKYVEGVLSNKKSTYKQKQQALLLLEMEVVHEGSHHLNIFNGTDAQGNQLVKSKKDSHDSDLGEPGTVVENLIWGIPQEQSEEDQKKPDVIPGVEPHNAKNKKGVVENIIKNAEQTEEGKTTLPTVPEPDKNTTTSTEKPKTTNKKGN